jgi:hypothetical protein
MSRGYPDFFGQQQFPSYGPFSILQGFTECPTGVFTDVFEIIGKCRLYTGILTTPESVINGDLWLKITVDSTVMSFSSMYSKRQYSIYENVNQILTLVHYEPIMNKYTFQLKEGITFGQSFKVSINPSAAGSLSVAYDVSYSRII